MGTKNNIKGKIELCKLWSAVSLHNFPKKCQNQCFKMKYFVWLLSDEIRRSNPYKFVRPVHRDGVFRSPSKCWKIKKLITWERMKDLKNEQTKKTGTFDTFWVIIFTVRLI